jgi:hypothetical protein
VLTAVFGYLGAMAPNSEHAHDGDDVRASYWNVRPLSRFSVNYTPTPPTGEPVEGTTAHRTNRRGRVRNAILRRDGKRS